MEIAANLLSTLGLFFGGLGILFLSFGLFWFVSVYSKDKEAKEKEEK